MAEGKKSFVLYSDYIELFTELSNEDAGKLIKHIFRYVNDENPQTKDPIVKFSFIPIKQQLKRDLKKYQGIKEQRSLAGKESARLRALQAQQSSTNPTSVESVEQSSTNPTVNVNGNVNETVNDIDNVTVNETKKRVAASGPPDEYKNIIKLWFEFVEKRNGVKPSFTAVDGKSLKSIIAYISKQQNKGQKTEDTFKFILDRWPTLSEWLQSNALDLKIFNSKINTVLDQIKNGTGTKQKGFTERVGQYFDATNPDYKDL